MHVVFLCHKLDQLITHHKSKDNPGNRDDHRFGEVSDHGKDAAVPCQRRLPHFTGDLAYFCIYRIEHARQVSRDPLGEQPAQPFIEFVEYAAHKRSRPALYRKARSAEAPGSCRSGQPHLRPSAASFPGSLLMCDKEAIEVQKILPFLSDTWPLCRIGRAVIRASQSCRQSCNKSQCPACGCRSHHSCNSCTTIFSIISRKRVGVSSSKARCLRTMPINFSALTVAACDLVQFGLQGGGSLFQLRLLGFVVSRQFHETLIADFAVYIVPHTAA